MWLKDSFFNEAGKVIYGNFTTNSTIFNTTTGVGGVLVSSAASSATFCKGVVSVNPAAKVLYFASGSLNCCSLALNTVCLATGRSPLTSTYAITTLTLASGCSYAASVCNVAADCMDPTSNLVGEAGGKVGMKCVELGIKRLMPWIAPFIGFGVNS